MAMKGQMVRFPLLRRRKGYQGRRKGYEDTLVFYIEMASIVQW